MNEEIMEIVELIMSKKKVEITSRTYRAHRYFVILLSLFTFACMLFALDFVISLFVDFPGIINFIDWIIANPTSLPWVLFILAVFLIVLEIFVEDIY